MKEKIRDKPRRTRKDGTPVKVGGTAVPMEIDENLVYELSRIHCTTNEIAIICKCSGDTLERRFMDVMNLGRSEGKSSLRRKQYQVAMEGNTGMLIWLGKQILSQREPQPIDVEKEKFTEYEIVITPKAIPHEAKT